MSPPPPAKMSAFPLAGHRPAIAFICVTGFLDALGMGLVGPVLPRLIEGFTGSNASAGAWNGVLAALWAGMQFLCSPAIGVASDRFGRRAVIVLSTAGLAANWVLMALAPNLWWLAVGRVLGGATSSTFTAIYAYMADITAPESRAKGYGIVGAAFSAGFVAGPALGGLLGMYGPRAPFWVAAGLSGLACLYGWWVLPESLPADKRTPFSWARANPVGAVAWLGRRRALIRLVAVGALAEFAQYSYWILFALYAEGRYGWSSMGIGGALAASGVLDIVVQGWLVGKVSGRCGDKRTLALGLGFGVLGFAAMGLAPSGAWFLLAMCLETGLGLALPAQQALLTARVSEREQGALQGAENSVASLAGMVSPLGFGRLYAATGQGLPGASFVAASGFLLTALGVGLTVPAPVRGAIREAGRDDTRGAARDPAQGTSR